MLPVVKRRGNGYKQAARTLMEEIRPEAQGAFRTQLYGDARDFRIESKNVVFSALFTKSALTA